MGSGHHQSSSLWFPTIFAVVVQLEEFRIRNAKIPGQFRSAAPVCYYMWCMNCPSCSTNQCRIVDSRPTSNNMTRRRYRCQCGNRFTTYEAIFDKEVIFKRMHNIGKFYKSRKLPRVIIPKKGAAEYVDKGSGSST